MRAARRLGVVAAAALALLAVASPAAAHPLGNSSTNLASELRVEPDRLVVRHLVDLAELRTVQLVPVVDTSGDGEIQDSEAAAYAEQACRATARDVRLRVDGRAAPLAPGPASLVLQAGDSGLPVARVACELTAPLSLARPVQIDYEDDSYRGRFGWREVTAVFDGTTAVRSDVPESSPSERLQSYPDEEALDALPDVRTASLQVRAGGPRLASSQDGGLQGALPGADGLTSRFASLVDDRALTVQLGALALLLAVVLGAGHALTPGHGKTVMAAYLVGQEGTRRQAVLLGGVVTLTHTAGVLLLGLLLLTSTTLASERLVALLQIASGVLLAAVGASLLLRAVRRSRALRELRDHPHDHDHDHPHPHDHDHPHDHPHPHGHDHPHHREPLVGGGPVGVLTAPAPPRAPARASELAPPERLLEHDHGLGRHTHVLPDPARPLGARSLAAMGVAGGLVPSPSALLVLLAANAAGRAWFGVLLVIAYGVGMAVTLTLAGLALLRVRSSLVARVLSGRGSSRTGRVVRLLPVLTAGVIVVAAAVVVLRGIGQLASFG